MTEAGAGQLRTSFGGAAAAYAEHRPDYAVPAVRWALAEAPGRRVLDLGAGTGKLTGTLIEAGADVIAVEPDPAMLAQLRTALPHVRATMGSAEAIPMPDGSVDAVVAGHAWHWFDMDVAGPEIARVLAPGGTLAGLWNVVDDRDDWVAGIRRVGGSAALGDRDLLSSWREATVHLAEAGASHFDDIDQAEFDHEQQHTVDSLVAKIATHAGVLVMPEPERRAVLERIRDHLAGTTETAPETGTFVLPVLTGVLRVRRR